MDTVIIGSGISGISAGYHLQKRGEKIVIYRSADTYVDDEYIGIGHAYYIFRRVDKTQQWKR